MYTTIFQGIINVEVNIIILQMTLVAGFVSRVAMGKGKMKLVSSVFYLPSCFMSLYDPNLREDKNLQPWKCKTGHFSAHEARCNPQRFEA